MLITLVSYCVLYNTAVYLLIIIKTCLKINLFVMYNITCFASPSENDLNTRTYITH